MEKWIGKVAVVTGASAGIGAQIVKDLAKAGMIVIGFARRPEKIEEFAKNSQGKIFARECDVSNRKSIIEAFDWIEKEFKIVNVLVNNAGVGKATQILTDDLSNADDLDQVIQTNFNGLVHTTKSAFQLMKKSDDYGMIININSIAGHITPFPGDGTSRANVYHGTKHAVTATTEILRQELVCMKNSKIRVSSVSPGVVDTDFFHAGKYIPDEVSMSDHLPCLRGEDISNAVLFLLSTDYRCNVTEMTVRPVGESF